MPRHKPSGAKSGGSAKGLNVLVVEDNATVGQLLKTLLEKSGHTFAGQAMHAAEAVELFRQTRPDLLLVDIQLNGDDGIALVQQLLAERPVPVVIVTAHSERALIQRAASAGVFGYLIKPISAELLEAQIHIAVQRFGEQQQLQTERNQLAQSLEDRKAIDRAKSILIRRLNLTEPEAHKRLQTESQKRRLGMAELARKIIESEDLLS